MNNKNIYIKKEKQPVPRYIKIYVKNHNEKLATAVRN